MMVHTHSQHMHLDSHSAAMMLEQAVRRHSRPVVRRVSRWNKREESKVGVAVRMAGGDAPGTQRAPVCCQSGGERSREEYSQECSAQGTGRHGAAGGRSGQPRQSARRVCTPHVKGLHNWASTTR
jgi:hypothetical protein